MTRSTYGSRRTLIGLLALAATAAAACSSDPTPTALVDPPASSGDAPAESPLGELLGVPITDDAAMQDFIAQAELDAENSIATCMRAEGFEYVPVDPRKSGNDEDFSFEPEDRSFAEEHGFGLMTGVFSQPDDSSYQDPNDDYVASLTPAERDQFFAALSGESSDEFAEPAGCAGAAYDQAFAFDRIFNLFGAEIGELVQAFESDPRIVEASSGWSACMAEVGYGYSSTTRAIQDMASRYEAVLNTDGTRLDPEGPAEVSVSDDGADIAISGLGPLTVEGQALVDEVAEDERAVAIASYDCNAPLREVEPAVQLEYEQRFVDEHGDAVRAALSDAG